MRAVMKEAEKAIRKGNSPYAAVLTDKEGNILATAHNTQRFSCDPTAHAEINLLRDAAKKMKTTKFPNYSLFSNTESCVMCVAACIKAEVTTFYFGSSYNEKIMDRDPDLGIYDIAKHSSKKLRIETDILPDDCLAQIEDGRIRLKKLFPKK